MLATWIVCHHAFPRHQELSAMSAVTMRVNVAVEAFVLLSGFVTHRSYSGQSNLLSNCRALQSFYMRRMGRVVFAAEVTMGLAAIGLWPSWKLLGCFMFIKPWFDPFPDCPNTSTWFVASMLPSWILYPLVTHRILLACQHRRGLLVLLMVFMWLLALAPALGFCIHNGGWLTLRQVTFTWFWPGALVPDFALGACVAALVANAPPRKALGTIADASLAVLFLLCMFAPVPTESITGAPEWWTTLPYSQWEAFTARLAAPFLTAFLYCSPGGGSRVARILAHPALVALGAYAMEVYLLQNLMRNMLFRVLRPAWWVWKGMPWDFTPEVFMTFFMLLWLAAGLFAEFVAEPARRFVYDFADRWEQDRVHGACLRYADVSGSGSEEEGNSR